MDVPRFPLRTLDDLLKRAPEIHADTCAWMGCDAQHPCTCKVPQVIRRLAAERAVNGDWPASGHEGHM